MDDHAIISGQHDETALALMDWIADHNEALQQPQQRRQEKACSLIQLRSKFLYNLFIAFDF